MLTTNATKNVKYYGKKSYIGRGLYQFFSFHLRIDHLIILHYIMVLILIVIMSIVVMMIMIMMIVMMMIVMMLMILNTLDFLNIVTNMLMYLRTCPMLFIRMKERLY